MTLCAWTLSHISIFSKLYEHSSLNSCFQKHFEHVLFKCISTISFLWTLDYIGRENPVCCIETKLEQFFLWTINVEIVKKFNSDWLNMLLVHGTLAK